MGKSIIGPLESNLEDIQRCRDYFTRMHPELPVPPFSEPGQYTIVIRDEDDPTRILGIIHTETATEVRHISVDPAYEHASMAATIAWNAMEAFFRLSGVKRYFATVPKGATRIQRFYRGDKNTVLTDENTDRFLKKL